MWFKQVIDYMKMKANPIEYGRKLGVQIGNNCQLLCKNPWSSEPYLIKIGDNVRINYGVSFITHDGSLWVLRTLAEEGVFPDPIKDADLFGRIIVGNNVQIGSNVTIMPNVIIGNNVIIGAGAIVTRSIPDNSVAVGIPARVIETIYEYYNKNKGCFDYTHSLSPKDRKKYLLEKYQM